MASNIKDGFLSSEETRRILHVSDVTLRSWHKDGKIEVIRAPGKNTHRRYNVKKFLTDKENKGFSTRMESSSSSPSTSRRKIIYARVSTRGQKENLDRQIIFLREKYPDYELITDIASGINFDRKGLATILDYAIKGELEEIVVAYKDRLTRFGFDHFKQLYSKLSNARIVVLDNRETSPDQELTEDILSIVTVFSAKINGRKKYGKRKSKDPEVQDLSFIETKEED